jgi:hypothetical protein
MLVFKYGLYLPIKIIDKARGKQIYFLVMYIAICGILLGIQL